MNGKFRLLILQLLFVLAIVPVAYAQDEAGDLLGRINGLRASRGLPPYTVNGALTAAAQQQAQWMAETGQVSHTRPDGSGPRSRAVANGYPTSDVAENIYGGTSANVDVAWNFWLNSGIHFNGMVNPRHQDIGIGIARSSWGVTYVTVFGSQGGPVFVPQAASAASAGGGDAAAAGPPPPPSYVIGADEHGNIMHEIQPGDTLGDIALIYGYTWDDIPYMMQLNNLANVAELEVGSVFLVPPKAGTYTPTPGDLQPTEAPPEATPTAQATTEQQIAQSTEPPPPTATEMPLPTVVIAPIGIATAAELPAELFEEPQVTEAALAPTAEIALVAAAITATPNSVVAPVVAPTGTITVTRSGTSPWLIAGVVVQVVILLAAGFEFFRRSRRK